MNMHKVFINSEHPQSDSKNKYSKQKEKRTLPISNKNNKFGLNKVFFSLLSKNPNPRILIFINRINKELDKNYLLNKKKGSLIHLNSISNSFFVLYLLNNITNQFDLTSSFFS
jgi:hypothetical protein